jgi:hypothetical protein
LAGRFCPAFLSIFASWQQLAPFGSGALSGQQLYFMIDFSPTNQAPIWVH